MRTSVQYSLTCSAINRGAYVYLNGIPTSAGPTLDQTVEADVTRWIKPGANVIHVALNGPTADENEVFIADGRLKEPEVSTSLVASKARAEVFSCSWIGRLSDAGMENISSGMSRRFDLDLNESVRLWQQVQPLSYTEARTELQDLLEALTAELNQGKSDLLQEIFAPAIEEERFLESNDELQSKLNRALEWIQRNHDRTWEAPDPDWFIVEPVCHGRLWRPQSLALDDQKGFDDFAWLPAAQNPRLYVDRRIDTPESDAEWEDLLERYPRFELGPLYFGKLNDRWIVVL